MTVGASGERICTRQFGGADVITEEAKICAIATEFRLDRQIIEAEDLRRYGSRRPIDEHFGIEV